MVRGEAVGFTVQLVPARNERLVQAIQAELAEAAAESAATGQSVAAEFRDFSWSHAGQLEPLPARDR